MNALDILSTTVAVAVCSAVPAYTSLEMPHSMYTSYSDGQVLKSYCNALPTINKIMSFKNLEADWNGYGAESFSETVIGAACDIVKILPVQPEVFPTGRGSIQMEYHSEDNTYTEFEIFSDGKATILHVPQGDISMAEEQEVSSKSYNDFSIYALKAKGCGANG